MGAGIGALSQEPRREQPICHTVRRQLLYLLVEYPVGLQAEQVMQIGVMVEVLTP
jgi:hypothetical protein